MTTAMPSDNPADPEKNDPNWKDITDDCNELVNELFAEAEKRFGPRTKKMPVRVTEFSNGPDIKFIDGVAYIRLGPGVGLHTPEQLRHQIAVEIVHALAVPSVPMTTLEEGAAAWFGHVAGGFLPEGVAQKKEKRAYELVNELLDKCPTVIKKLRQPPRPICAISADEIQKACPKFPAERLGDLVAPW
jgi:hypothetical protein